MLEPRPRVYRNARKRYLFLQMTELAQRTQNWYWILTSHTYFLVFTHMLQLTDCVIIFIIHGSQPLLREVRGSFSSSVSAEGCPPKSPLESRMAWGIFLCPGILINGIILSSQSYLLLGQCLRRLISGKGRIHLIAV